MLAAIMVRTVSSVAVGPNLVRRVEWTYSIPSAAMVLPDSVSEGVGVFASWIGSQCNNVKITILTWVIGRLLKGTLWWVG